MKCMNPIQIWGFCQPSLTQDLPWTLLDVVRQHKVRGSAALSVPACAVPVGSGPSGLPVAGRLPGRSPRQQPLPAPGRGSRLITHSPLSHHPGAGPSQRRSAASGVGLPRRRAQPRRTGQALALGGCRPCQPVPVRVRVRIRRWPPPRPSRSLPVAGGRCRRGRPPAPWRPGRHCPRKRVNPTREAAGDCPTHRKPPAPPRPSPPSSPRVGLPARRPLDLPSGSSTPRPRSPPSRGGPTPPGPVPALRRRREAAARCPPLPSPCVRRRARRGTSRRGAGRRRQLTAHPRK